MSLSRSKAHGTWRVVSVMHGRSYSLGVVRYPTFSLYNPSLVNEVVVLAFYPTKRSGTPFERRKIQSNTLL